MRAFYSNTMTIAVLAAAMVIPHAGGRAADAPARPASAVAARLDKALQASQRREGHDEAVRICDDVLGSAEASPAEKFAAAEILVDVLRQQSKFNEAAAAAERLRKAIPGDAAADLKAAALQADVLKAAKKEPEAIAVLRQALARAGSAEQAAAELYVRLAELMLNAKQVPDVYDAASKAVDLAPRNDELVGRALYVIQEAASRTDDLQRGLEALGRLIDPRYLTRRDPWQQRDLRLRYGHWLRRLKRFDEARNHYLAMQKIEKERPGAEPRHIQEWTYLVAESFADEGRDDDALAAFERVFTDHPDVADYWLAAQRRMADILFRKGRFEDAIRAARVCLDAARDDGQLSDAVRLIAEALKGLDNHVGRANAFIYYQRYGPAGADGKAGTDDDLKDPVSSLGYLPMAAREKALEEARRRAGDDSRAMRFRAMTYIFSGKPKEALRCFIDAFARSSGEDIQTAAQDMVLIGARAVRGYAAGLDAFYQFVNYGPAGADGKVGTDDDLPDPFAPLVK